MYATPEARAIRKQLEQNAREKSSQQPKVILKTSCEVIGTPTQVVRKLAKRLWNSFRRNTEALFPILKDMWGKSHEEQMLVCYVLNLGLKQESKRMLQFAQEHLFSSTNDWAVSDLLGRFFGQYMILENELTVKNLVSPSLNPLQKRIIIASLTELVSNDARKAWTTMAFQIIQEFLGDDELIVRKAIRKFIRIAYLTDSAKTIAILYDWALKRKIPTAQAMKFYAQKIPKEHLSGILGSY